MPNRPFSPLRLSRAACLPILLTMLCACAPLAPAAAEPDVLVWQASGKRYNSVDALLQQAAAADIVLLGETHDNAAHHALQRRVLAALAERDPPPVLVMEQFDIEQQERLDAIMASGASRDILQPATQRQSPASFTGLRSPCWSTREVPSASCTKF